MLLDDADTELEIIGIDDEIIRRDSLHAVINSLPDPNYATLRALILVCSPTFLHAPQDVVTH